jgi:dUTP pyrophosphatase
LTAYAPQGALGEKSVDTMNADTAMELKIKRVRPQAQMPVRATEGSAAVDLCAVCDSQGVTLQPGQRAVLPTGIAIELPGPHTVALVFARSGLGIRHGLTLSNGVGVIDSDYRGEICVGLINLGEAPYTVQNGERIAQLAVMPVCLPTLVEVQQLSDTARGTGGLGSTGRGAVGEGD